jgi:acetyltransferase-like isoleucine patch superfamily enzyme
MGQHVGAQLQRPPLEFTIVQARASIGTHATTLPNLTIGRGAMIGATAFVVTDVPNHAVVAGVPARVIGDVREKERARQC